MIDREILAKMNKAVVRLHQDKDTPYLCRQFLTDLSEFIDFKVGVLALAQNADNTLEPKSAIMKSVYGRAFEELFSADLDKYKSCDYLNWLLSSTQSFVYRDSEIVKQELRLNSKYYTEVLKKNNLIHACGMIIVNDQLLSGSLALYRDSGSGDFSEEDLFILDYFLPHLEQTLEEYSQQVIQKSNPSYILKEQLNLTEREIEIVQLIIEGYTNKEISEMLNVQTNTIKKHIYNIFNKFDVSSRTQLIRYILQHGMLGLFIKE